MITREELRASLPANLKSTATQSMVDKLNNIAADPIIANEIAERYIDCISVLNEGKFSTEQYFNAVSFVSRVIAGATNQDAYAATFPERMIEMAANGYDAKAVSSIVAAYNKGKLVNLVREQALVPMWVLNSNLYQRALNVQADLMTSASSELVRTQAANSLLTALQKPKEAANLKININTGSENKAMETLADALNSLSSAQAEGIRNGTLSMREIASKPIIEGEYEDVN